MRGDSAQEAGGKMYLSSCSYKRKRQKIRRTDREICNCYVCMYVYIWEKEEGHQGKEESRGGGGGSVCVCVTA